MAAKFKSFGLEATADNSPSGYSIPTVRLPDGSYLMDSRKIAGVLEVLQPEPSLRLDSGYVERVQSAVLTIHQGLAPMTITRVPDVLLNPSSADYFRETRKERFGMSLSELAKSDKSGEAAWGKAKPGIQEVISILHEHQQGPYVLGETASYADLILAGLWAFVKKVNGDAFERLLGYDEVLNGHYEACRGFLRREDH